MKFLIAAALFVITFLKTYNWYDDKSTNSDEVTSLTLRKIIVLAKKLAQDVPVSMAVQNEYSLEKRGANIAMG